MRRLQRSIVLLFIVMVCLLTAATPTQAARQITQSEWQQLTKDEAFGYKNELELKPRKPNNKLQAFLNRVLNFFASPTGRALMWTLFFLLVAWALYKIFLSDKTFLFGKKQKSRAVETEENTEDITDTNWELKLQQAMQNGDLRQAVRYSYMRLLQLLQENELIHYRSDKTNHEYYRELTDSKFKQPFRQLSRQYEYTWYGHFPLSQPVYDEYMQTYNGVKQQLHS